MTSIMTVVSRDSFQICFFECRFAFLSVLEFSTFSRVVRCMYLSSAFLPEALENVPVSTINLFLLLLQDFYMNKISDGSLANLLHRRA